METTPFRDDTLTIVPLALARHFIQICTTVADEVVGLTGQQGLAGGAGFHRTGQHMQDLAG